MMATGQMHSEYRSGFPGGDRFVLRVVPPASIAACGVILCIQPFLDEATLARRVLAEQARRLALAGWVTWIPDLLGTGDSPGDTPHANLETWRHELAQWAALARKAVHNGPLVLWGTRMGATLAAQLSGDTGVSHHLLLWQAPPDGRSLVDPLRKLSRLRSTAPASVDERPPSATPDSTPVDAGALEFLAGYRLDPQLLQGLESLASTPQGATSAQGEQHALLLHTQRVVRDGQSPPAPLMQLADRWAQAGWQVQTAVVAGEPYWSSMEPTTPLAGFERTEAWLRELPTLSDAAAQIDELPSDRPPSKVIAEASVSEAVAERAVMMVGEQGPLLAILSMPRISGGQGSPQSAALIVPGQPQTRVGSHRMFVELARGLAGCGIVTLRFDVGGWGDSPGEPRAFERSAHDIAVAARMLAEAASGPSRQAARVWVGGLCDGASAAMLALPAIERAGVSPAGVYLLNPWVRSEASLGDAMIKNYYAKRVLDPELWRRIFTGKVGLRNLVVDPIRHLSAKLLAGGTRTSASGSGGTDLDPAAATAGADLPSTFITHREAFKGRLATILSGADLTAAETESLISGDSRWKRGIEGKGAALLRIPDADHTLTRQEHWALAITWLAKQIRQ